VAFAVVTGSAIAARAGSPAVRALARGYPPLVALLVTATGNHYVLDSVGGAMLGAAASRLARGRAVDKRTVAATGV
jgi:PAP2 superfamily